MISSGAPATVESLVLVSMLTLVVSHRVLNQIRLLVPEKSDRFTPLRWGETFYSAANVVMSRTLKYAEIDEVGYLPVKEIEGNLFFQLISELQEQTSIIITTNKGFEDWTEFLGDPALATAILDRLTYRCDKILMNGVSYRLENRKSIMDPRNETRIGRE